MTMTSLTNQPPTEEELIAYDCGYRACCFDNGIPYVRAESPFVSYNKFIAFHIEMSDKSAEFIFPDHVDALAKHIADELKDEYEKFKQHNN